jgi:hypothetical protein
MSAVDAVAQEPYKSGKSYLPIKPYHAPPLAQSAKHGNGSESRTMSIKEFPLVVTLFSGLTHDAQVDAVFLKSGPTVCICWDWASTVAVWLIRDREH